MVEEVVVMEVKVVGMVDFQNIGYEQNLNKES